jgi:hypothetical protein
MLLERNEPGDVEKARSLLEEAHATYFELGIDSYVASTLHERAAAPAPKQ